MLLRDPRVSLHAKSGRKKLVFLPAKHPRTNSFGQHYPQQNFPRNAFQPRGNQPNFKPIPMDTTSGNFAKRNTSAQLPIPKRQRPGFTSEELFYQDDAAYDEGYDYVDQVQDESQDYYEYDPQQFEDNAAYQQNQIDESNDQNFQNAPSEKPVTYYSDIKITIYHNSGN